MESRWTVVDFVLVALGGVAGSFALGLAAYAMTDGEGVVVLSLAGQYVGYLLVLWLIARTREMGAASLGFDIRPTDVLYVGVGVLLQIGLAVVSLPLQRLVLPEGGNAQQIADILTDLASPVARVSAAVMTVLIGPLMEELLFRGVLLRSLAHRSRRLVLVVTAVVFAAYHLLDQVVSFGAGLLVFGQILVVGLVLAHLTLRHDRLGPAIFVHAGFNLLGAIVFLLPPEALEQLQQMGS